MAHPHKTMAKSPPYTEVGHLEHNNKEKEKAQKISESHQNLL